MIQTFHIIVPFHALQHFSLEVKVNVSFSENAKELNWPSLIMCREQERLHCNSVMSGCELIHFAFIRDCVVHISSEVSGHSPHL